MPLNDAFEYWFEYTGLISVEEAITNFIPSILDNTQQRCM